MGSGATLVDGVRRWFQRRSSTTSFLANNSNSNNNNDKQNKNNSKIVVHDNYDGHVSVSELRAESSTAHRRETKAGGEEELTIVEEDFDVSGLKLIKVPLRFHVKAFSMETQKKVLFDCLLPFVDLGLLDFQF